MLTDTYINAHPSLTYTAGSENLDKITPGNQSSQKRSPRSKHFPPSARGYLALTRHDDTGHGEVTENTEDNSQHLSSVNPRGPEEADRDRDNADSNVYLLSGGDESGSDEMAVEAVSDPDPAGDSIATGSHQPVDPPDQVKTALNRPSLSPHLLPSLNPLNPLNITLLTLLTLIQADMDSLLLMRRIDTLYYDPHEEARHLSLKHPDWTLEQKKQYRADINRQAAVDRVKGVGSKNGSGGGSENTDSNPKEGLSGIGDKSLDFFPSFDTVKEIVSPVYNTTHYPSPEPTLNPP